MGEILATLLGLLAALHGFNETAFLVEIPRDNLLYQLVRVTALLTGALLELRFNLDGEVDFHDLYNTRKAALGQRC